MDDGQKIPQAEKRIHEMTDAELKELRWSQSVIGTMQECLIVGVHAENGEVIAIPVDENARAKVTDEVRAIAVQQYRASRS